MALLGYKGFWAFWRLLALLALLASFGLFWTERRSALSFGNAAYRSKYCTIDTPNCRSNIHVKFFFFQGRCLGGQWRIKIEATFLTTTLPSCTASRETPGPAWRGCNNNKSSLSNHGNCARRTSGTRGRAAHGRR